MTAYVVQQVVVDQRRHYEMKDDIFTRDGSRIAVLLQQLMKSQPELAIPWIIPPPLAHRDSTFVIPSRGQ